MTNTINGVENWTIQNLVEDIMELSQSFFNVTFDCVSRKFNKAAHDLTKFGVATTLIIVFDLPN